MTIKLPLQRHFASMHCEVLTENEKPLYGNEVVCAATEVAQLEAAYAELLRQHEFDDALLAGDGVVMDSQKERIAELEAERDGLRETLIEIRDWTRRYTSPGHPIITVAERALNKRHCENDG